MSVTTTYEADILSRIIGPQTPDLSAEAARSILALSFDGEDLKRMNELSAKAADGRLTDEEQEELDCYERVGHLLALLQSKARASLQHTLSPSDGT